MSNAALPPTAVPSVVTRASFAVTAVFVLNGLFLANWLSRLPVVRDQLDLTPSTIGWILLFGSAGSVCALPLAGAVVERIGTVRTVVASAIVAGAGLALVGIAVGLGSTVGIAGALAFASAGIAGWDIAMNIEGGRVERALGRSVMPRYHAGFSLGTVIGATMGALATRLEISLGVHLAALAVVIIALVAVAVRWFLSTHAPEMAEADGAASDAPLGDAIPALAGRRSPFAAWLEPRTLLIGLLVLSAALTEGAANDWLGLAAIEGFGLQNDHAAFVLTIFLAAMTAMRFFGVRLLDRWGRVAVLRLCIGLALTGLLVFGLSPWLPLAVAGAVLWGFGAALGFPVGISAASDDPEHAAARVSVVASIGYTAFLAGPPLLGMLAEQVGYRSALLAICVPLVISLLVTGIAAPVRSEDQQPTPQA